jgi:N-hydroxyarylamine O-acetyltransferase
VTTERAPIYEKIVHRRRGGWCYEMNGLFGWALATLGFDVVRMASGVMREASGDSTVGNHLVLWVSLPQGIYLADVGFGDGSIEPIRLAPGEFTDGRFSFALSQPETGWWRVHNHPYGGARSFDFQLKPADENLLAEKCTLLQTSESSVFVQTLVCQRYTQEGLLVLRGRVLRTIRRDGYQDRLLGGADELIATLAEEFNLAVPEVADLWPKICTRHKAMFGE